MPMKPRTPISNPFPKGYVDCGMDDEMKKQYRVWKWDNDEKQLLWLTDAEVVEYRRAGYYVAEA